MSHIIYLTHLVTIRFLQVPCCYVTPITKIIWKQYYFWTISHEWNSEGFHGLTVLQQVNTLQPFLPCAFCNTSYGSGKGSLFTDAFFTKKRNLTSEMTKQISKVMDRLTGVSPLHTHHHTPGLNYKEKDNRYLSNTVTTTFVFDTSETVLRSIDSS